VRFLWTRHVLSLWLFGLEVVFWGFERFDTPLISLTVNRPLLIEGMAFRVFRDDFLFFLRGSKCS